MPGITIKLHCPRASLPEPRLRQAGSGHEKGVALSTPVGGEEVFGLFSDQI